MLLSLFALVQAVHKARLGESALLKWKPAIEALQRGEQIYGREENATREGFPTLPLTALVLAPFLELGDVPGATLWAALKIALSWFIVLTALQLAAGTAPDFPGWGTLLVVALSSRVLLSDIAHGNINIAVGATVVAAARAWSRGRDLRAGIWIGLGAVLKVTPALFLVYFVRKRGARALAGLALGVALFAFVVPAPILGWSFHLELMRAWWAQMIEPFVSGAPLTIVQTEQINQSFLGVCARLFSDSVAVRARPPAFPEPLSIHVLALSPGELRAVVLALSAATLAALWICIDPRRERRDPRRTLGEFSLVALAMLFLSERSWKHHYVLLAFPLAFLAWHCASRERGDRVVWISAMGLCASACLHGLTGSGVLGDRGSDLAEAYGAFLAGGLALFIACAIVLQATRSEAERLAQR